MLLLTQIEMRTSENPNLNDMDYQTMQDLPPDFLEFLTEKKTEQNIIEKSFVRSSVIQRNCHLDYQQHLEEDEPCQGY